MATNDKRLRVTELDFDAIKSNLKTYLKAQNEFKDYDFEGSGMSVLLDTLAYNTHYLGFNANMLANEMFLDSASLRSSVVSHAKTLGYETTSVRAPYATINVSLSTTANTKTMSAGTAFTTSIDGTSYQFVTIADVTSSNTGNAIPFDSVNVYEGTYVTTRYTVDSSDVDQRFLVNNPNADTSTLTVKIQTSASDTTTTTYTKATDITQLTSNSTVYYLQETDSGKYEVYFGDGIVSKSLADGNIVILQYVVTIKTEANGALSFSSPTSIDSVTSITVTTVASATGGSEAESIDSIKSTTGENLTTVQKSNLVAAFAPFKVASITPVVVDPETTYLILNVSFNYDSTSTTSTKNELASLIGTTISNYNSNNLQQFNTSFRHSKLTGLIDDTDSSILNNTTTVTMGKFFTPVSTNLSYTINFNNAFYNPYTGYNSPVIASTGFYLDNSTETEYFFDDDGSGNLRIYSLSTGQVRTYLNSSAGTVDYVNGTISTISLLISAVSDVDGASSTKIRITSIPQSNDIIPVRNQILEIDLVNTITGGSVDAQATTGVGYTVTSTGTTSTTTVTTPSSTPTSSAY